MQENVNARPRQNRERQQMDECPTHGAQKRSFGRKASMGCRRGAGRGLGAGRKLGKCDAGERNSQQGRRAFRNQSIAE